VGWGSREGGRSYRPRHSSRWEREQEVESSINADAIDQRVQFYATQQSRMEMTEVASAPIKSGQCVEWVNSHEVRFTNRRQPMS
jgi:hypothetical protein